MLVELAVGDAYGAGFEFAPASFVIERNTLDGYVQSPVDQDKRPGCYTDDTQMSLAVAEHLLAGSLCNAESFADRFVAAYRRDPRAGYSRHTRALLESSRTGAELIASVSPGRASSGAAMRVAPLGLLEDVSSVVRLAALQARVTHLDAAAVESACAAALAVHYCHYRLGATASVGEWVGRTLRAAGQGSVRWAEPWEGPVGWPGVDCVRAALTALAECDGLRSLLGACVAFTGDVDTVAAIALAAGSRAADITSDLPDTLVAGLENGPYGRDHLADLDRRLLSRYPGRS